MILDGKKVANEILENISKKLSKDQIDLGLALILVGDNPASRIYVEAKKKACQKVGIRSTIIALPQTISENDLITKIASLNRDPHIHGILLQLPLPLHIQERAVVETIDPKKDVDGFHPVNVGRMLLGDERAFFPCTPLGIVTLLQKYAIPVTGKHVVILGRSNIVGKPLAAMLMQKKEGCNATVTIAHSQSENLQEISLSADILVAAMGKAQLVKKEMVKNGATVIDVGINRIQGKIVGDVDFDSVSTVAANITPVPGGIGPMTIAMLLQNTLRSYLSIL